jgi:hypothetical protein
MDVRLNVDEWMIIDIAEPYSYGAVNVRLPKALVDRFIAAKAEIYKIQDEIEPYYDKAQDLQTQKWRAKREAEEKKKVIERKPPLPVCKVTVAAPYPVETESLTRADVAKERKRPAPQVPAHLAFLVD